MNRASLYLAPFVSLSKLPFCREAQFSLHSWESRGWKSDLSKVTATQELIGNKVQRVEVGMGCKHDAAECQECWRTCIYSTRNPN